MPEQLRFLLSGTNRPIVTYQGNTMDTGLRRYDGVVWLGSYFCVYCATMSISNFLVPIPAFAHPQNLAILRGPEQE